MRLSSHRWYQLAGHVDRDGAGFATTSQSFGVSRRRRCRSGFPAPEWFLWRGADALWQAECLPCPQSCSHRRDRAVHARLRAWGRLPRCKVCRIRAHLARTLRDLALTHGGQPGLGASFRCSLLRGHRGTLSRHRHPFTKHRQWKATDGSTRRTVEIVANRLQALSSKSASEAPAAWPPGLIPEGALTQPSRGRLARSTNLLGFGAFQDCTEPQGVKTVRAAASLRYSRRTTSPPLDPLLPLRALPHP